MSHMKMLLKSIIKPIHCHDFVVVKVKLMWFIDWRRGDQRAQESCLGWTHSLHGESDSEGPRKHLYWRANQDYPQSEGIHVSIVTQWRIVTKSRGSCKYCHTHHHCHRIIYNDFINTQKMYCYPSVIIQWHSDFSLCMAKFN